MKMIEKPCRIILIDDSTVDRFILKRSLSLMRVSCAVTEFEKSADALEFLSGLGPNAKAKPSLIIADMQIPGSMDGYEIIKAIREMPYLEKTPIAAITAYRPPYEPVMAILSGANYFFDKPLSGESLQKMALVATGQK